MRISEIVILVIGICLLLASVGLLIGASTKYRSPTPEDMLQNYSQQAMEHMIEALKAAKIAGMIQESLNCPCYDVTVSTTDTSVILRVDRDRCVEE
jgi:pyruvate/2-oxoglutarate/acetoin dehydrogenase E1 component